MIRAGLCWAGSPGHRNDRQRSIHDAAVLAPLLALPGVEWHSLQVGSRLEEHDALGLARPDLPDYGATARLMATLDVVITVDTSVAHLGGGLGVTTWVLLPFFGEWRWGTDPRATPWYDTVRLFRQAAPGDWPGVIARVAGALTALRYLEVA